MKSIVIVTALNCEKKVEALKTSMKNVLSFGNILKCCSMKPKNQHLKDISTKKDLKVLAIDSNAVTQETALSYVKSIKEKMIPLEVVIFGNDYKIPGVKNHTSWEQIKEIAA